jgi:hypothetical protein
MNEYAVLIYIIIIFGAMALFAKLADLIDGK